MNYETQYSVCEVLPSKPSILYFLKLRLRLRGEISDSQLKFHMSIVDVIFEWQNGNMWQLWQLWQCDSVTVQSAGVTRVMRVMRGGGQLSGSDSEWQHPPRTLWSPVVTGAGSGHWLRHVLCLRHWDTRHTNQYSVFRQTDNQQQQNDRQGYPRPSLRPSWIVFPDWSGQRFQRVSFVPQPIRCDTLEVSGMDCVRINP